MNPGPPEYEASLLATRPRLSVSCGPNTRLARLDIYFLRNRLSQNRWLNLVVSQINPVHTFIIIIIIGSTALRGPWSSSEASAS
jgi:hypothetical protein